MFRVTSLYSQILNSFHNILLKNNFNHKVFNPKFHYKIMIKGGEGLKLMSLFDLKIYLFLAKANNKDKTQLSFR